MTFTMPTTLKDPAKQAQVSAILEAHWAAHPQDRPTSMAEHLTQANEICNMLDNTSGRFK